MCELPFLFHQPSLAASDETPECQRIKQVVTDGQFSINPYNYKSISRGKIIWRLSCLSALYAAGGGLVGVFGGCFVWDLGFDVVA